MRVIFAIPTIDGKLTSKTHQSLLVTYGLLAKEKIEFDEIFLTDCPYMATARNTLVAMFMEDPEATDLFFVDADLGFNPGSVLRMLEREEEIIAGIYPLKRDEGGYPVKLKTKDGAIIRKDGLLEAILMPTGFARIKRGVFELMAEAYPELKYNTSVVEVRESGITLAYDYFNVGVDKEVQRLFTEDFVFSQRWQDIGGECWVYPDIDFTHIGTKGYTGNYLKHLIALGG